MEYVWLLLVGVELFGKELGVPLYNAYATEALCKTDTDRLKKEFPDSRFVCIRVKITK